jgi:hypothetical protein
MTSRKWGKATKVVKKPVQQVVVPKAPDDPELSDELVSYYVKQAQAESMVYAQAIVQVLDKLYRDDDFYQSRQVAKKSNGYDKGLLYDLRAIAWLARACQLYVPAEIQQQPLPGLAHETARDAAEAELLPQVDMLFHVQQPDRVLVIYVSMARAAGVVYALAIKHCIKRIYQDHAYLLRRQAKGIHTDYDPKLVADAQALAFLVRLAGAYVPDTIKRHPIPPLPPKPNRQQPRTAKAKKQRQQQQRQHDILYHPQPIR